LIYHQYKCKRCKKRYEQIESESTYLLDVVFVERYHPSSHRHKCSEKAYGIAELIGFEEK
jgi:hypothetical protein